MTETASQRARARLRTEMHRRHLSQVDLASLIGWTQSKVSKVLHGETELTVDDLESLCFGVDLRVTETVRDPGLEFCAELTPHELRVIEELRRHAGTVDALMQLLRIPAPPAPRALAKKSPRVSASAAGRSAAGRKNITT